MPANYPASLPVKESAGANLSTNPHSQLHDDMYDEIVAIGTELGTAVRGTYSNLKARLEANEARVCARIRRNAAQSIGTTWTLINFDNETQDTDGFITVTDDTLVVPAGKGGLYAITYFLTATNDVTSALVANTNEYPSYSAVTVDGTANINAGTIVQVLPDAGEVQLYGRCPGGTQNVTGFLSMFRIGN